jgi:hypothetical protein
VGWGRWEGTWYAEPPSVTAVPTVASCGCGLCGHCGLWAHLVAACSSMVVPVCIMMVHILSISHTLYHALTTTQTTQPHTFCHSSSLPPPPPSLSLSLSLSRSLSLPPPPLSSLGGQHGYHATDDPQTDGSPDATRDQDSSTIGGTATH